MKSLIKILFVSFLFASCSNGDLTKGEALELLQKDYPKTIFYSIYTADPDHANKVTKQGFVKAGLVTIDSSAAFLKQSIFFTDKAKDLLLPTPESDKVRLIQRVKTAEKYVKEISGIKMMGKGKAVVEFTTFYKNLTPFATLSKKAISEGQEDQESVYFSKYTDGWRIDNNPLLQ